MQVNQWVKCIIGAAVVWLSSGAMALPISSSGYSTEPFGRIQVDKVIIMPNSSGHSDWTDAIKSARKSVHLEMYHITDKAVISALSSKAKQSNIDLRVIVDGQLKGGYQKAFDELSQAGVNVRASSKAFSITHTKAMVIDDQSAFVTAINMTNTATNTRDFGIVTPDSNIISELDAVFEADWANAEDDGDNTPNLTDNNLAWSPNDSTEQLTKLIGSATQTLDIEVENLTSDDIVNAFNQAAARGVNVRLIVPECSLGNSLLNYPAIAKLNGVSVHVEHNGSSMDQPYMHSKMMVADGKRIYIGSINFSYNSLTKAREVGVLFLDETTGSTLESEFQTDWDRSQDPSPSPSCRSSGSSSSGESGGSGRYHLPSSLRAVI